MTSFDFGGVELMSPLSWKKIKAEYTVADPIIPGAFRNSESDLAIPNFGIRMFKIGIPRSINLSPDRNVFSSEQGVDLSVWLKSASSGTQDFSSDVSIAIIDTGFSTATKWADFGLTGSSDDQAPGGHGTHCADIIKQINPKALLLNAKIFDENANAPLSRVFSAIFWSVELGAKVISMSIAAKFPDSNWFEAYSRVVDFCAQKGVQIFSAIGYQAVDNENGSAFSDFALAKHVVNVSAEDYQPQPGWAHWHDCIGPTFVSVSTLLTAFKGNSAACPVAAAAYSLFLKKVGGSRQLAWLEFLSALNFKLVQKP